MDDWMDDWGDDIERKGSDGKAKKGGERRLIRIIGSKAQDEIAHRSHHEGVPSHRHRGECFVANVLAGIFV